MTYYELNLDGLVGPTHHYAGLSLGNLASTGNALKPANPKAAALQGIAKMRLLHSLGIKQGLLPPHQRPHFALLGQLGFSGNPAAQLKAAARDAPRLLSAAFSASSMWAANTATVSASLDTLDHRVHFTPANLVSNLHRHQESAFSAHLLQTLFSDPRFFCHHLALPACSITSDEGAANHSRLCERHNSKGVHLFVYGKSHYEKGTEPRQFPARQTLEASQAIARAHGLPPQQVVFAQQNPKAIDAGVFHNDVIAVANESVLLLHEDAFVSQEAVLHALQEKSDFPMQCIIIPANRLSVAEAVSTYLFNSQLITLPEKNHQMALIAPIECQENSKVSALIDEIIASSTNPVSAVHYFDLKQSMQNGGGPACLRLRVPLSEIELQAMQQSILVTPTLLDKLENLVNKHYRDTLHFHDLASPLFVNECFTALDALSQVFQLGNIYPFQREKN
ncbi:MAG: N-succinylarginine dihydrolase [Tatlockia sp.]|jgi:succinylarginine dihydrolase